MVRIVQFSPREMRRLMDGQRHRQPWDDPSQDEDEPLDESGDLHPHSDETVRLRVYTYVQGGPQSTVRIRRPV